MKYSDFVENLADDLQEAFRVRERKIEVEIMEVSKPWGKELGISFSEGGIAHPILYPQKQYEYHEAGMNYFLMLNQMIDEIESAFSNVPEKFEFDPCTLKDTITIQLVNTERCRQYLLDKAHREVEDLSIIYRLNADFGGGNNGSSVITTKMMEMMGMNEKELYELAMEKAPLNRLCTIKSMVETIEELMEETHEIPEVPVMVVTNEDRYLGASAIMYPGILERCTEVMNGDFYILPSSQHEVLIYSDNSSLRLDELEAIVQEVNEKELDPRDFLSDNVYHYDHKEKIFELSEKYVDRMRYKEKYSVIDSLNGKKNDVMKKSSLRRNQDIGSRKVQGLSL